MNTLQKDYSSSIIDDYKSFYKTPTVSLELPHEIWPPNGNDSELLDIGNQRNLDIRIAGKSGLMCAEKTGGFNLVNYRHSSGVYHEQETEDLHRRI